MKAITLLLALLTSLPCLADTYDLVIEGGRVMDPESGLDAVRNVGINGHRVARISSDSLSGRRVLKARGLVVAPGFIDLHQHAQDLESGRLKALDGVTTALELEIGVADVAAFLDAKRGRSYVHFGSSASHAAARAAAFGKPLRADELIPAAGPATDDAASETQIQTVEQRLRHELGAGALGVGIGLEYTPGATREEIIRMFHLAAVGGVPVFTHVRGGNRVEPNSGIQSVEEVIGAAAITGAALHIVHINSMCTRQSSTCLDMVAGARARGLDVTTEAYPYTAAMTFINSAVFNPGWQEAQGISYADLGLPDGGERLTRERFDALRAAPKPQLVLMYINSEAVVDEVLANPLVMIASDGGPGHPRNAGSFARVLSRQVRQLGRISLMDALRQMTLMPAQRLEKATPAARTKGRLQEGADADVVVFDPATVADHATYAAPRQASTGMRYVIVGGTLLIEEGKLVGGVYPGEALRH